MPGPRQKRYRQCAAERPDPIHAGEHADAARPEAEIVLADDRNHRGGPDNHRVRRPTEAAELMGSKE